MNGKCVFDFLRDRQFFDDQLKVKIVLYLVLRLAHVRF